MSYSDGDKPSRRRIINESSSQQIFNRLRWELEPDGNLRRESFSLRICIAQHIVEFRFTDPRWHAVLQSAFRHVTAESVDDAESLPPSLTVLCGVVDPHAVIAPTPAVNAGLIFFDGPVRVAWDRSSDGVSAYDRSGRIGIWAFPSIDSVPVWELASPMRRVFHWWSADQGMLLMHGAAVGFSDFGILLAGKGGAGKSTTALASIGLGWKYAGDDYCLIAPGMTPQIHSLYCSGKVSAASISRLPRIRNLFDESTLKIEQKTIAFLYPEWGNEFVRSLPLSAVVTPRIAHRSDPIIQPVSAAKAMLSLAPSTMMQMPGERPYSLTTLAEIARSTPCFELMLSDNPDAAYTCLADLRLRSSK